MSHGLQFILLVFALFGFAGAGASIAVARYRRMADGERDLGMIGVAGMLSLFGALCTLVGAGLAGILAFGGVMLWASYLFMAQHLGLFRIETRHAPPTAEEHAEETGRLE